MGYAVYHMEKGQTSSGGIGNHIDRKKGAEHTYQHADPNRQHLNKNYEVHQGREKIPLHQAIEERIKEGYTGQKAIRKDAVKYKTHILTGSHEDMKRIFSNPQTAQKWIDENKKFIEKEFGKENVVRFTLHMDEKTPHIHAVTIPLTEDGRLTAKEIIGNKKEMQARQDRYAYSMMEFGLERGVRNTGIKHENATEYYARMNQAKDVADKTEIKVEKGLLGSYKAESVQELENSVKSLKVALKSKDLEIEAKNRQIKQTADRNTDLKQGREQIKENFNNILGNPQLYEQERNKAIQKHSLEVVNEIGKKVDVKFSLKFENEEQRTEFIGRTLQDIAKEKNISNEMMKSVLKEEETKQKIIAKVKEREDVLNRDRGKDRGFSR